MNRRPTVCHLVTCILLCCAFFLIGQTTHGAFVNGGFETGDLTGWSPSPSSLVVVTTGPLAKLAASGSWSPTEGSYFAYMATGAGDGIYTFLSQVFTATAGDTLSFNAFFDTGDFLPFNDDGYVNLIISGLTTTLYSHSVATVGNYGSSGWTPVSYVIPLTGSYQIEAGVRNVADNEVQSRVGLDNVRLVCAVPEAASIIVWSVGVVLCVVVFRAHAHHGSNRTI